MFGSRFGIGRGGLDFPRALKMERHGFRFRIGQSGVGARQEQVMAAFGEAGGMPQMILE